MIRPSNQAALELAAAILCECEDFDVTPIALRQYLRRMQLSPHEPTMREKIYKLCHDAIGDEVDG